jgi:outer membrane protein assembly factor BamB
MSTTPQTRLRRWRVPLALILLTVVANALPRLWWWADLDPTPLRKFEMAGVIVTALCLVVLPVWFFLFSTFPARAKAIALVVLVVLCGAGFAAVREVDVHGGLGLILKFRWEQPPVEQLGTGNMPPIDLTIDRVHDFPRYRGASADGVVHLPAPLDADWEKNPPKLLWRRPCGGGFAGIAVAGNVAITIEQRGGDEAVVCYDRATGQERWAHAYAAHFKDFTGHGPRATPTIAGDGLIYSLGAVGDLLCLDGKTGAVKWQTNILADSRAKCVTWGMSGSPLVVDDLVIVNAGIDAANNAEEALAAYNRLNGKRVWASGKYGAGYSSPQLATLAGRRQVLIFDAGGLAGHDMKTGDELWRYAWETYQDMNITQPLVIGEDRVFIASEMSNGGALLRITRGKGGFDVEPVWTTKQLASKFSNPIQRGEALYGLSNGTLVCLDAATGERRWRGRPYGHGQVLGVGGHIVVMSERGYVALVMADPRRFREVARMEVFADKTWNTPAVAGRQLFVRNHVEMACFELPTK